LEQSGSAVQSKLAFLDDQMRKLWVVSNERNKKDIKGNAEALALVTGNMKDLERWRENFEKATKSVQLKQTTAVNGFTLQYSVLQGESERLDDRVVLLANEVVIMREEQQSTVEKRKQGEELISSLSKQLAESKKAISSIDASRLQLNERVIGMEQQINKLQLTIKSNASDVQ
jgi:chromosome segregation ATPase